VTRSAKKFSKTAANNFTQLAGNFQHALDRIADKIQYAKKLFYKNILKICLPALEK
jgi:hypothetical protein